MDDDDTPEAKALRDALVARLDREPCLSPLAPDDAAQFGLFDLSSYASLRCATHIEPEALLDPTLHAYWLKRVAQGSWIDVPFALGRRPYWIIHEGKRIGTIAFMVEYFTREPTIELSSVYVRQEYRRKGWGSRILELLTAAAFEVGLERVTLHTEWSAQSALRFYCSQGMWLRMWKDDLQLHMDRDLPRWQMEVHEDEAHFLIESRVVGIAHSRGRRLEWWVDETLDWGLKFSLEMTAALQLALMHWPIIRSDELWQERLHNGCGDAGTFEHFALRMRQFESYIRERGWTVPAQTNPSFASFPHLVEVNHHVDHLVVDLSDGAHLEIPVSMLRYFMDAGDKLERVRIVNGEVECVYRSGKRIFLSVDDLLRLEHDKSTPHAVVCIMRSPESDS